jgi:hypothetical protein
MLAETSGISSPDVRINGIYGDFKWLVGHNNILRHAKKAITKQGASIVLFCFTQENEDIHTELLLLDRKYDINALYFFEGKETLYNNMPDK